jgi:hypoxanthine phosphoribosyltransferase
MSDLQFQPLISQATIDHKIAEMSHILDAQYQGKELVIVMIMKGALCFVADLIRALHVPCSLDFLTCSSYGMRGTQAGQLRISGLDRLDVEGKHVLLIDDIFDSGKTLSQVYSRISMMDPASVKSLVLLQRHTQQTVVYRPDYTLFEVKEGLFVVGYGLDYKEQFRGLPGIFVLRNPPV